MNVLIDHFSLHLFPFLLFFKNLFFCSKQLHRINFYSSFLPDPFWSIISLSTSSRMTFHLPFFLIFVKVNATIFYKQYLILSAEASIILFCFLHLKKNPSCFHLWYHIYTDSHRQIVRFVIAVETFWYHHTSSFKFQILFSPIYIYIYIYNWR